jgi:hypothetical protein
MLIFGAIRAGPLAYMARLLAEYVTCILLNCYHILDLHAKVKFVYTLLSRLFDKLVKPSIPRY